MQNYKKYHLPISYWYYEICATIENTAEPHPKSVSTVQEDSIDKWKLHITQTEWQYRKLAQKQVFISDHACSLQSRILQWVTSPPGDLPNPGSNPGLLCLVHWQVSSLPLAPPGKSLISDHFDTKEISLEVQSDVKNRQFKLAQEVRKQW